MIHIFIERHMPMLQRHWRKKDSSYIKHRNILRIFKIITEISISFILESDKCINLVEIQQQLGQQTDRERHVICS